MSCMCRVLRKRATPPCMVRRESKRRNVADPVGLHRLAEGVGPLFEVAGVHQIVEVGGVLEEALHVRRIFAHLARLLRHAIHLGIEVHHLAVFEEVAPVGTQGSDGDVVAHPLAAALEETGEEVRQRENGRAQIEAVAALLEHVELAADLRVLLVDGDPVALLGQRDGRRQSAEPRPDDDDLSSCPCSTSPC